MRIYFSSSGSQYPYMIITSWISLMPMILLYFLLVTSNWATGLQQYAPFFLKNNYLYKLIILWFSLLICLSSIYAQIWISWTELSALKIGTFTSPPVRRENGFGTWSGYWTFYWWFSSEGRSASSIGLHWECNKEGNCGSPPCWRLLKGEKLCLCGAHLPILFPIVSL